MNRTEALEILSSSVASQRERLEAARVLARAAIGADIDALKRALRDERIPWVRSALEKGIARASSQPIDDGESRNVLPLVSEDDVLAEVYARALEELTDRFVHEFRPLVGLARLSASTEIPNYEASQLWSVLTQMQDLLAAIDTLGKVAAVPSPSDFDLAELVAEVILQCTQEFESRAGVPSLRVQTDGPSFSPVHADRDLVTVALKNGLRNAIEASVDREVPIVVTWGQSDSDYWTAVLDRGQGLPGDPDGLFTIGSSSKPHHSGMGLAIARRAATTLGGEVELSTAADGTTRFELRCPFGES